jgi:hypothetical protein
MENNNINSIASIEVTSNGTGSIHTFNSLGKEYINIPIELIKYAIMHKSINQLKLFIGLKDLTSGQFHLDHNSIVQFSNRIEVNPRTLKTHIKWLLDKHWIVLNSKSGSYRVISFDQLSRKLKHGSKTGALFFTTYYKEFRGFVYAAFITYWMKYLYRNNNKNWDKAKPMRKKGRTKKSLAPDFYYLPHQYLANVLNTTKANAAKYRYTAVRSGFIKVTKNFSKLDLNIDQVKLFKKYGFEQDNLIVCRRNRVYIQQSDILSSSILLRSKKNLSVLGKKRHLIRRD